MVGDIFPEAEAGPALVLAPIMSLVHISKESKSEAVQAGARPPSLEPTPELPSPGSLPP